MKKNILVVILLIGICFWACNQGGKKKSDDAKDQVENHDADTTDKDDETIEKQNTESASYYEDFLIENQSLDFIKIGHALPDPIPDFVSYEISEKTKMVNGVVQKENSFIITDMGAQVVNVKITDNLVESIVVLAPVAVTAEGIGVGSSISEVMETYPGSSILFNKTNDQFYVTTTQYSNVQFILNRDSYSGDNVPEKSFSLNDFSIDAKIVTVVVE